MSAGTKDDRSNGRPGRVPSPEALLYLVRRPSAPSPPVGALRAPAVIRGTVVAERTEQPLAHVLVRLADTKHAATTGSDGRFELRQIAPGDRTLTASVVGYALVRRAVSIAPARTLKFVIVLTAGTGTYEERLDVVAPIFEARERR